MGMPSDQGRTTRPALQRARWVAALLITTALVAGGAEAGATLRTLRNAQAASSRQDYGQAVWEYDHTGLLLSTRPSVRRARAEAVTLSASQSAWELGAVRFTDGDWLGAVQALSAVVPEDVHAADAHRLAEEAREYRTESLAARATLQARDERTWRLEERARRRAAAYRTLVQTLERERASWPGSVSIYFQDLQDGTTIDIDGGRPYFAASLYKLAVLADLFHEESLREVALDDSIAFRPEDFEEGYFEDYAPGQALTVAQLAERMIEESDNTSARMLARTLSWDGVQDYAHGLGAANAQIAGDNEMTPRDAAALLAGIYQGRVAPVPETEAMLALLEHTVYVDEWIPSALPQVTVAHKVGFYGSAINDAALVLAPDHPFILVVFTDSAGTMAPTIFQTVAAQTYAFATASPAP